MQCSFCSLHTVHKFLFVFRKHSEKIFFANNKMQREVEEQKTPSCPFSGVCLIYFQAGATAEVAAASAVRRNPDLPKLIPYSQTLTRPAPSLLLMLFKNPRLFEVVHAEIGLLQLRLWSLHQCQLPLDLPKSNAQASQFLMCKMHCRQGATRTNTRLHHIIHQLSWIIGLQKSL